MTFSLYWFIESCAVLTIVVVVYSLPIDDDAVSFFSAFFFPTCVWLKKWFNAFQWKQIKRLNQFLFKFHENVCISFIFDVLVVPNHCRGYKILFIRGCCQGDRHANNTECANKDFFACHVFPSVFIKFHRDFKCISSWSDSSEEYFAGWRKIKAKAKKKSLIFYDDSYGFIVKCCRNTEQSVKCPPLS